jgi:hypothetical protein
MSYFLRGAILSSAAFFLVYVALSLGVAIAWRVIDQRAESCTASLLFGLRALPLSIATFFAAFLVVPSFLYLEPYRTSEVIGVTGLTLAGGGFLTLGFGAVSVLFAWWETARFIAHCPRTASVEVNGSENIAVGIAGTTPILAVVGIYQPKLLISEGATGLLEPAEMQAAIRHELAHVGFCDNLKKLILRFTTFPFLAGLDRSWMQAAEVAADDAAALNESAAVDLASALLKVAPQSNAGRVPELAMSLAPNADKALRARVERLLAWQPREPRSRRLPVGIVLCAVALLTATYLPLLQHVHELTELLVR